MLPLTSAMFDVLVEDILIQKVISRQPAVKA